MYNSIGLQIDLQAEQYFRIRLVSSDCCLEADINSINLSLEHLQTWPTFQVTS